MEEKKKENVKERSTVRRNNPPYEGGRKEEVDELKSIFQKLTQTEQKSLPVQSLLDYLSENGISKNDERLKDSIGPFLRKPEGLQSALSFENFTTLLQDDKSRLIHRVFRKELAIPQFQEFRKDIEQIFEQTKGNTEGEVDDSLPHPETEGPPPYGVSICTVDGQLLQLGDHDLSFSVQSICKAVNYAIALEEQGEETLHKYVGVEPGSESFDTGMVLNENDLPHNPLINSGAIMTSSLIKPDLKVEERLKHVMDVWEKLSGDKPVSYKEESFIAERSSADKNLALAHLMKERGAFPENTDIDTTIDFYLKCCAIEVKIDLLANVAASLANFGICPITGRRIFMHDTVKKTLSLMLTSGVYDHSGEFAFRVGLPAKSGIAGGLMVVVPNLMGIAIYSPPLDSHGNSVRAVKFCEKLVEKFNFHLLDSSSGPGHGKKDPRF